MPRPTDLAKVLRAAGLPVVEHPGWKTRGHGGLAGIQGVIVHHTAGPRRGALPSLHTLIHGRPGLPGPLANIALARDGTVHVIAAGRAYHAGVGRHAGITSGNLHTFGFEMENDGHHEPYTASQLTNAPRTVAAICRAWKLSPDVVIGHYEWAPQRKVDPRTWPGQMAAFRRSVRTVLRGPAPKRRVVKRVTTAVSRAKARVTGKLVVDGKFGPATARVLVTRLGHSHWDAGAKAELQRRVGAKPDGVIGPATVRKLQLHLGARPIDGVWGKVTTEALQRALNRGWLL